MTRGGVIIDLRSQLYWIKRHPGDSKVQLWMVLDRINQDEDTQHPECTLGSMIVSALDCFEGKMSSYCQAIKNSEFYVDL